MKKLEEEYKIISMDISRLDETQSLCGNNAKADLSRYVFFMQTYMFNLECILCFMPGLESKL